MSSKIEIVQCYEHFSEFLEYQDPDAVIKVKLSSFIFHFESVQRLIATFIWEIKAVGSEKYEYEYRQKKDVQ